jgi:hypothetical protein
MCGGVRDCETHTNGFATAEEGRAAFVAWRDAGGQSSHTSVSEWTLQRDTIITLPEPKRGSSEQCAQFCEEMANCKSWNHSNSGSTCSFSTADELAPCLEERADGLMWTRCGGHILTTGTCGLRAARPITIISAIYGSNCDGSDQTETLHAACDGLEICTYRIDHHDIGDPCPNIRKTYKVTYMCADENESRTAQVVGESSGKDLVLDCTKQETNTLTSLGNDRCMSNGVLVPLHRENASNTRVSKNECVVTCEADPNCLAAMSAYDYYCNHFTAADPLVDGIANGYQRQWECFARSNPDKIVTMQMTAQGWTSTDFDAHKAELAASLASKLGITDGQVELSLTPFQRRRLMQTESLNIYAKIQAKEEEMEAINSRTSDLEALSRDVSNEIEGVSFEVKNTDVQAFESSTTNTASATKEDVSLTTFLIAVCCLLVGLGGGSVGYAYWYQPKSAEDAIDAEMGMPKRTPSLKMDISLQKLYDSQSNSNGAGTSALQDGESLAM